MKVLIIEDEKDIVESVSLTVQIRWPEALIVFTDLGKRGIELAHSEKPDVIVLDLGLPDIGGFEVLKQIRLFSSVPIIILTVIGDKDDMIKGLEWGADDYIVKPCGRLELLARIKARTRSGKSSTEESPLCSGPLRFDPLKLQLLCRNKEIKLTSIEANIIQCLLRNAGNVVPHSRLVEELWGDNYPGTLDSLRVHIRRLRQKVELDPDHPQFIVTKPGAGYLLAKP